MLVRKTREEEEGVLKSFLQGFSMNLVNLSMLPIEVKILTKKMKGKTLGNTLKAQADMPFKVASIYTDGKITMFIKI
jgi:hypothetical protein